MVMMIPLTQDASIAKSTKLTKDEGGKDAEQKIYQGIISSLFYLTVSRPDVMFSVCSCAHFKSCPKELHLKVVKGFLDIFLAKKC